MERLEEFLFGANFVPHAVCLLWRPDLLLLHGGSDFFIAIAYFTIPLVILKATKARPDLINRNVALMFAAFILACGLSHLAGLITLWLPLYGLQGLIKMATAAASIYTAFMLVRLLPGFLSLPSREDLIRKDAALIVQAREREKIEEQNRQLADFAYVAAHDLRAPLRGMKAVTEMLQEDLPRDVAQRQEIAEELELLKQQSDRMQALVVDLQEYASVGADIHTHEPVDLRQTVQKVVDLLRPPEAFQIDVAGDLPEIDLVRAKVELVLRNLISNAIKHNDRPSGRVIVRGVGWDGGKFRIDVEDDGPGIP